MTTLHRSARALLVAAAASALALGSATTAVSAPAAPEGAPVSTPVDFPLEDGVLMSYVVLTKDNPGHTKRTERAIEQSGGTVVQSWAQIGVVVAHSTDGEFLEQVTQHRAVQSAGPTRTEAVKEGTPGDLNWSNGPGASGWNRDKQAYDVDVLGQRTAGDGEADSLEHYQWGNRAVGADDAHTVSQGSAGITVGILDSGIDATHPDLDEQVDPSASVNCSNAGVPDQDPGAWADDHGHGTHVAGTVAAEDDGRGTVGIAPNVKVAAVKTGNVDGWFYPEYVVCGFVWAADHGIDVTNSSYYSDPMMYWCEDQPLQAPAIAAVQRAVDYATDNGVTNVAAAGNAATDLANLETDSTSPNDSEPIDRVINSGCVDMPAQLDGVVTVSATSTAPREDGAWYLEDLVTWEVGDAQPLAVFSNYGDGQIDVAAPGYPILSTVPTWYYDDPAAAYEAWGGTSMASPHAAGVAALLASEHPDASPAELTAMLEQQAIDLGAPGYDEFYGQGLVNAEAAVTG